MGPFCASASGIPRRKIRDRAMVTKNPLHI
jgi:hypothetical protein